MSFLPRSRLALAVAGFCAVACLLLGAAALLTGRAPVAASSAVGGPFALVDQDGKPVSQDTFAGHPYIVFFGYTHCPDVCPTTLNDMSQLLEALGPNSDVAAAFVTVDPERDTPAVMKDYLSSFDGRIRALTGSPEAVAAAIRSFRVYARKVPAGSGGDYTMDHTAVVYLMDGQGRFVTALNLQQPPKEAAREVRRALGLAEPPSSGKA